ncbi:zona pellucida sperm-binding protein 3-like [Seriola lalandi dorsalis]|uniref:zona pellucida sperm-binding protein 3-like n=1 Tax=Seriola lalandi dorsalis TaxID=1841481 RepID=UPI000C6F8B9C|nr:zona pellucida sperm-binding protein 3-like [Seriola lalandi dorsalis]
MKTKWHLYILWSVLSLGLLGCAADTYESPFTRRKKVFKLGTPKSDPIKLSTTGDRKSPHRSPAPLSQLSSKRHHPAPTPVTPRSMRPVKPEAKVRSHLAFLPDVSVTCSTSDFVVRVKPAFYGLGADAQELKLGSSCKSNGVLRPYGDILFTYPLTACDAVREVPQGYLVYKFVLHYEPSPKRLPSRAHRIDINIECRYQRNHHVYQLAVKPTWQTAVVRKTLKGRPSHFQIELMADSWSIPAKSLVYQLGQTVNVQVSAPHLPSGGKLYISSCYATPSSGSQSSLKYTIIDKFGCMLDSKRDPGASWFIYRTDRTLRFSLKAFQFTADPDTEVSIHCKLSVTSEEPSPAHKSCTYRGNRWRALTGDDSICECCDSQCVTTKTWRAMMSGSASSESLLISDQPYTAEDDFLPASPSLVIMGREDETTVSRHIDDLHGQESLWESADVVKYDDDYEEEEEDYTEKELEEDEAESRVILEVMTDDREFEELVFRHGVLVEKRKEVEVNDLNEFGVDGSGYELEEDFFEGEEEEERPEGREDEISDAQQAIHLNQKEGEVLRHWAQLEQLKVSLQREVQPLDSEGEEGNRKYTDGGEEDERTRAYEVEWKRDDGLADVAVHREMTWYFTWR